MPPLVQPTLTMAATPPTQVVMWDGGGMKSSGGNLSYPCGPHERRGGARSSTDLRDAESRWVRRLSEFEMKKRLFFIACNVAPVLLPRVTSRPLLRAGSLVPGDTL